MNMRNPMLLKGNCHYKWQYLATTMKRTFLILALCNALLCGVNAKREICINGKWLFMYAADSQKADSIAAAGFGNPAFDATAFDEIEVPSCWAILGYEEPVYREFKEAPHSEGFYIRHFTVPEEFRGKRLTLDFGGVWASAEVWLNGHYLGRHDSGYTSFSMNVPSNAVFFSSGAADAAKSKGDNVLAVRVRQVYPGYVCDTYDDWSLGGIYRDVTLTAKPSKCWIDKVTAITDFDDRYEDADLRVKVMVYDNHKNSKPGNYRLVGPDYQLRYQLADGDGCMVVDETRTVQGHPLIGRQYEETFRVSRPRQWSAESPALYTLSISLIEDGQVRQQEVQKIGFREISTQGGVFRINGQPVKLRGVNRHDEWPDVGRATTREHWLHDLQMMKDANINYVRACHYQHAKGFIEMCDSMGMYVGAEVSLGGAGDLMTDRQFVPGLMLRTFETVNRDLNNPSIIYWSVGNEDSFNQMFYDAAKVVKALDPTRPVLYPWCADLRLPEEIDIIAPHYWTSYEYDSICAASCRPIITTEYVHAYGIQRFGGLADCWKALHDRPQGAGGAVWMWADQGIVTPTKWTDKKYKSLSGGNEYLRISSEGWDGITDSYRNPTRDYYEVKSVYAPIYPSVEELDASSISNVEIPIHNDYDFLTSDDIDILYKVFADGKKTGEGKTRLSILPHEDGIMPVKTGISRLKAGETAYIQLFFCKDGKEICRKSVVIGRGNPSPESRRGGKETFAFDPKTCMPADFRPTIWHKMNEGDQIIRGKVDGEKYSLRIVASKRTATDRGFRVVTEAVCEINDSNSVHGTYTFDADTISRRMTVNYAMTPQIASGRYVPLIGMAIKGTPQAWLGLGPEEAYPNKKASEIFGLWDARKLKGTRAAEWVDIISGRQRMRIMLTNEGGTYTTGARGFIDRDAEDSQEIRICSHILGRSEKGRLNDRNYRLEPSGKTYYGTFVVTK